MFLIWGIETSWGSFYVLASASARFFPAALTLRYTYSCILLPQFMPSISQGGDAVV